MTAVLDAVAPPATPVMAMMPAAAVVADMDGDPRRRRRDRTQGTDSCQRDRAGQNNLLHAKLPIAESGK